MRTFFALPLDDATKARLAGLAAELRRDAPGKLSWVPEANYHLTVRFLGELDDERLALARAAGAEAAAAAAPFALAFQGAGTFPGGRARPSVVWVGTKTDAGLAAAKTLAQALERALVARGLGPADKPFAAHVTLARVGRERRAPDGLVAAVEARRAVDVGTAPVGGLVLYASKLGGQGGPVYTPVETFALGAPVGNAS